MLQTATPITAENIQQFTITASAIMLQSTACTKYRINQTDLADIFAAAVDTPHKPDNLQGMLPFMLVFSQSGITASEAASHVVSAISKKEESKQAEAITNIMSVVFQLTQQGQLANFQALGASINTMIQEKFPQYFVTESSSTPPKTMSFKAPAPSTTSSSRKVSLSSDDSETSSIVILNGDTRPTPPSIVLSPAQSILFTGTNPPPPPSKSKSITPWALTLPAITALAVGTLFVLSPMGTAAFFGTAASSVAFLSTGAGLLALGGVGLLVSANYAMRVKQATRPANSN